MVSAVEGLREANLHSPPSRAKLPPLRAECKPARRPPCAGPPARPPRPAPANRPPGRPPRPALANRPPPPMLKPERARLQLSRAHSCQLSLTSPSRAQPPQKRYHSEDAFSGLPTVPLAWPLDLVLSRLPPIVRTGGSRLARARAAGRTQPAADCGRVEVDSTSTDNTG